MARITDQNRIERLKKSTMKLVVEKGFGGASTAAIAVNAKVAAGYFYMHYKGKYEMVNALLHSVYEEIMEKLEELAQNGSSIDKMIEEMIHHFFLMANEDPIKIKFLYVLTNDYSFVIDGNVKQNTFLFIDRFLNIGKEKNMIDKQLTSEDIYLFLVVNTIQYINQLFKSLDDNYTFTNEDEKHLVYLINKTLK